MSWVVIVDRTVDPFNPRWPLVIGPFREEDTATVKAATIRRGLERADLEDRSVTVWPLDRGSTAIARIVEDAA